MSDPLTINKLNAKDLVRSLSMFLIKNALPSPKSFLLYNAIKLPECISNIHFILNMLFIFSSIFKAEKIKNLYNSKNI
jgi:hypothetical protein